MKAGFELKDGALVPSTGEQPTILVYAAPSEQEKQQLIATLRLDAYDLESALDPDEISRVEFANDRVALIWKRPKNASFDQRLQLDVASLGLFLHQDRLLVIMSELAIPFAAKEFQGAGSAVEILLRFLLHTVHHYLGHLKAIKQLTVELESKISSSMENRYLLQMFALGESLIYYLNAIEANGAVLAKLRGNVERLKLLRQQVESLDDIILENQQCARQAQIYSSVLSGLMDARGTIINNNMNVLLKNLTLINIIFLPLNLIASIGGMSEYSMMTKGADWRLSYAIFSLGMVVLGWVTWVVLVRSLDKRQRKRENFKH
ncbi:magnesium transporter CorA family protein [candidate division KSB1 bacterium]|nr:magnesium transporter CorA family protein [bacterium]NUM65592.1 magnesium transporter CorA family protein [candidate division KSB1 bacterium]